MLAIEIQLSNDGARAARSEIRSFLAHENKKMAGDLPDRQKNAALGYAILRSIMEKIDREVTAQDQRIAVRERHEREQSRPTVREARGR